MKARLIVALFILLLNAPMAQASIEPILAVDTFFTALNAGNVDTALAAFAEDATVDILLRHETYHGVAEIGQLLQAMWREGRQHEIVRLQMADDTISATVEISDHGHLWGRETINAEVKRGKIQTLTMTAFQLARYH